jgi:FkbM family methyltransferase
MTQFTLPNGVCVDAADEAEIALLYQEIFVNACYLRGGVSLEPGDTVVDVGAHVGLASLFFHRCMRDLQFIDIEPSPPTFGSLTRNLASNGVRATPLNMGVADREEVREFHFYPSATGMSGQYTDPDHDRALTAGHLESQGMSREDIDELLTDRYRRVPFRCHVRPLHSLLDDLGVREVGLLKIDAERSELEIVEAIPRHRWKTIRQVTAEVHDEPGRVARVQEILSEAGFTVDVISSTVITISDVVHVIGVRSGQTGGTSC